MPDPHSSDPHPSPRAAADVAADDIAADLERLRRTASARRFRLRLRREVHRAEVAVLAFGVVAAGFLALHLAQRGNEVSLTARTAASSSTSPPAPSDHEPGATTNPPSEAPRRRPAPAPPTTVTATATVTAPASTPRPHDVPSDVGPDTATTMAAPAIEVPPTTSTSTTSSTTTTTPTTTTAPPPPA